MFNLRPRSSLFVYVCVPFVSLPDTAAVTAPDEVSRRGQYRCHRVWHVRLACLVQASMLLLSRSVFYLCSVL